MSSDKPLRDRLQACLEVAVSNLETSLHDNVGQFRMLVHARAEAVAHITMAIAQTPNKSPVDLVVSQERYAELEKSFEEVQIDNDLLADALQQAIAICGRAKEREIRFVPTGGDSSFEPTPGQPFIRYVLDEPNLPENIEKWVKVLDESD